MVWEQRNHMVFEDKEPKVKKWKTAMVSNLWGLDMGIRYGKYIQLCTFYKLFG